jgi:hypothetical protein
VVFQLVEELQYLITASAIEPCLGFQAKTHLELTMLLIIDLLKSIATLQPLGLVKAALRIPVGPEKYLLRYAGAVMHISLLYPLYHYEETQSLSSKSEIRGTS